MEHGSASRKPSFVSIPRTATTSSTSFPLHPDPSSAESRSESRGGQLRGAQHIVRGHTTTPRISTARDIPHEETLTDFLRSTAEASYSVRNYRHQEQREEHSQRRHQQYNAGSGCYATLPHTRKRVGSIQQDESSGKRRPDSTLSRPQMDESNGSTSTNPIDLTSPPRLQRPHRTNSGGRQASPSSIILPRWQPDEEVSCCPVCGAQFGILYRRHHCRKCGKVVCAGCSPHRITIPRQFIVHPPTSNTASPFAALGASWDSNASGSLATSPRRPHSHLSGGEVVRVCNPCVPDPNLSPPPQSQSPTHGPAPNNSYESNLYPGYSHGRQPGPQSAVSRRTLGDQTPSFTAQVSGTPFTPQYQPTRRPGVRIGQEQMPSGSAQRHPSRQYPSSSHYHLPTPSRYSSSANPQSNLNQQRRATVSTLHNHYVSPRTFLDSVAPPNSLSTRHNDSRMDHISEGGAPSRYAPNNASPSRPQAVSEQRAALPEAQRVIAEEDECPVCGVELPQKGLNGDETARTSHVEECLGRYSVGSSPPVIPTMGASTSASAPSTSTSILARLPNSQMSGSSVSQFPPFQQGSTQYEPSTLASTAMQLPADAQPSAAQARRMTGGRMLVYRASEKDCLAEDGTPQECIICFEEFAVSDEMGRLECLCKFHKACIRSWWEAKGAGSCPTHQLHQ